MHEAKMIHKQKGDEIIPFIIKQTIQQGKIICFDEFQVTDIADAVILRQLFTSLLNHGVIMIATSNRPPQDLYLNGLQRDLFIPFIHLLDEQTHVVSMWDSDVDYRLIQGIHKNRGVYFIGGNHYHHSNNEEKMKFEKVYQTLTKNTPSTSTILTTQGRKVEIPVACINHSICKFKFDVLCREAKGAADYLLIGHHFHTVFVEDVPKLSLNEINLVRRFITFVDAMYECHVTLIIHAETNMNDIFKVDLENQHCDEAFAFDRTRSRLEEMGSDEYLKTNGKKWNEKKKTD
jgi:predicted ATPase